MPSIVVAIFLSSYLSTLVVLLTTDRVDNVAGVVLYLLAPLALVLGVGIYEMIRGRR